MSTKPTDAELLQAWRAGDDGAGDRLVRRHFMTVYRFFANKVAPSVADDLLQATFVSCLDRRERLRDDAGFRAYLLGIARIELLRHFRKKGRLDRAKRLEHLTVEQLGGSPSRVVAEAQEQELLAMALRRIPLDIQITLELYYWEELSVAEMAAVLDIPPGTVKSRLFRGRELLRAQILSLEGDPALHDSTIGDLDRWAKSMRRVLDANADADE